VLFALQCKRRKPHGSVNVCRVSHNIVRTITLDRILSTMTLDPIVAVNLDLVVAKIALDYTVAQ
jgi:hypothetical protein